MNEVIENIFARRSVRMYQDKTLPAEVVDQLVKAGNAAPTVDVAGEPSPAVGASTN